MKYFNTPRIYLFIFAVVAAFCAGCCSKQDGSNKECWVQTYEYGQIFIGVCGRFSEDVCYEVGIEEEEKIYRCPCPENGCVCAENPPEDGGILTRFGCEWEVGDYCYEGPPTEWYPIGSCSCYAQYQCWSRCVGYPVADGGLLCSLDGGNSVCLTKPVAVHDKCDFEEGCAVLCEYGPEPVPYGVLDLELP